MSKFRFALPSFVSHYKSANSVFLIFNPEIALHLDVEDQGFSEDAHEGRPHRVSRIYTHLPGVHTYVSKLYNNNVLEILSVLISIVFPQYPDMHSTFQTCGTDCDA